jgi:hypothetical protein
MARHHRTDQAAGISARCTRCGGQAFARGGSAMPHDFTPAGDLDLRIDITPSVVHETPSLPGWPYPRWNSGHRATSCRSIGVEIRT